MGTCKERSRIASQAQKEVTHNEALQSLDFLVAPAVMALGAQSPPASPSAGEAYVVGSAPTGAFAGRTHQIAGYTAGGWRFLQPTEGMQLFVRADNCVALFAGGQWLLGRINAKAVHIDGKQVLAGQAAAIADPAGGSVQDLPCRAALASVLAALRQHGLIAA
ncbi:DUF2793 domain-containing protein [Sphingomonas ginkgonis]|uniref:DUF2793 domain-containing protein n=1 Tax=Sphingomonas ginkgonis TaxID=2315330 RepID=A0A3R9YP10_9SPHN|nr:DUF2793 domain-containing protein [Sphingomonas ginkgonis]RST31848.1 DUF2793 domain-containing protein [Sphingomonas ginkgonis]